MNKFIFCLLLLPILLVGVCAVSASSDLDADVPVIGSEHPAFVGSESELPALEGHVASERPALEGHVASESVASESVVSELLALVASDYVVSESGLLALVGSESVVSELPALVGSESGLLALVGSEHPAFVASELLALVGSESVGSESGLLALVGSESVASESGLLALVGSELPALVGTDFPALVGHVWYQSLGAIQLQYSYESIVKDSNMEVFSYFPFGPHLAPAAETSVNFESRV